MPKKISQTFADVLNVWAAHVPPDMRNEEPRDKSLDSFLRFFDSLSAANITALPPRAELFQILHRAVHWQWIALGISMPPLFSAVMPKVLTVAAARWLRIWRRDKTAGQQQLMAAIDRDLGRIYTAAQYAGWPQKD